MEPEPEPWVAPKMDHFDKTATQLTFTHWLTSNQLQDNDELAEMGDAMTDEEIDPLEKLVVMHSEHGDDLFAAFFPDDHVSRAKFRAAVLRLQLQPEVEDIDDDY